MNFISNSSSLHKLEWDSEYFKVRSARAVLNKAVSAQEWEVLKEEFENYQFVTIVNKNSNPHNSRLIGLETPGFLIDVNIQFMKKIKTLQYWNSSITIHQALKENQTIIDIAEFQFSRFEDDPNLAKRGGSSIYKVWLLNSFDKKDKFFAISRNECNKINGFLLYSFQNKKCVIELIAVDGKSQNKGIGKKLIHAVEYKIHSENYQEILVGTQLRNIPAINFYQKNGFKQVSCDQIFHLWK